MSMIPQYKERIQEVDEQIKNATCNLAELHAKRKKFVEYIQENCSHPEEFHLTENTNTNRDPLACARYTLTCTACGKQLESYDMVQGRKIPC